MPILLGAAMAAALASGQDAPGGDMARIAGNCHQKLAGRGGKGRIGAGILRFWP
jgi:hypothetical protein